MAKYIATFVIDVEEEDDLELVLDKMTDVAYRLDYEGEVSIEERGLDPV